MRHLLFLIPLLLASTLSAKEVSVPACTADGYKTTLPLVLVDRDLANNPSIEPTIRQAFIDTAREFSAEALTTQAGFYDFVGRLTAEQYAAIEWMTIPSVDRQIACDPKAVERGDHHRQ